MLYTKADAKDYAKERLTGIWVEPERALDVERNLGGRAKPDA